MPMQPSPSAETTNPELPSVLVPIALSAWFLMSTTLPVGRAIPG